MRHSVKKAGLVILKTIRPVFQAFARRHTAYFLELRQHFATDPYLCAMIFRFSRFHEWVFRPNFEKVRVDPAEIEAIRDMAHRGTLVYVMKNGGQLEYSYFNHRFLKEGIPLARFANGSRTLYWRPWRQIGRLLMARLDYYYEKGLLDDPIQSGYLENIVVRGESALLNLKVSRELIFGAMEDPLEFIPPLLEAARRSEKPVYLITQQFIYDRHPDKAKKSWVDLVFGEKSNPGMFRKLILFLMSYRKRATVKFGEALDLKKFVQENAQDDPKDMANKLHNVLLSRLMIERKSITGPTLQPKDKFLDKILRNKYFKDTLEAIQKETGRSRQELETQISDHFNEIAASIDYAYVDVYDHLIRWLLNNVFDGLDLDMAGLSKVKAVAGKYPIVLAPSHKSHLDYLLLSYIFYNYDLTLPHICAGINLKFWPVARLIRRAGGFFIRRSIGGDRVYKLVLEHYLKALVRDGYSMEFFIEGTRSRTGKLLKPKMGILSMLMEAYLDGDATDIYFVPIAINYERILEEKSYVGEIRGASKEKENVRGLLGARKSFGKKYGKVFIRFSDPISVKEFFDEKGIQPKQGTIENYRHEVDEFAYRITYNINRVAVVTTTSIAAMALLSSPRRGLAEPELFRRIHLLRGYLEYKGASFSGIIEQGGDWAYKEALNKLVQDRMVGLHEDFQGRFYTIDNTRRPILDYHKNNSIHFFVSLFCFSKILDTATVSTLSLNEVKKRYEGLKTLLRHDFTFSQRTSLDEHLLKVIEYYMRRGLVTLDENRQKISFERCRTSPDFKLFSSLLDNLLESSYVTLLYLKYVAFNRVEVKKLVKSILDKGQVLYLKGDLNYPEGVSRFNIENALAVYKDLGLVRKESSGLMTRLEDPETVNRWEDNLRKLLHWESLNDAALQGTFESVETLETAAVIKGPSDLH